MQAPGVPGKKGDQVNYRILYILTKLSVNAQTIPHSDGFPLCCCVVPPQGERGLPGLDGSRGEKGEPGLRGEKVSNQGMMTLLEHIELFLCTVHLRFGTYLNNIFLFLGRFSRGLQGQEGPVFLDLKESQEKE